MSGMKEHISDIVEAIDFNFGDGYARKNPELVGRLVQADYMGLSATLIQEGLFALAYEDEELVH